MSTWDDEEYDDLMEYQESLHDLSALTEEVERLRDDNLPLLYEDDPLDASFDLENDAEHIVDRFMREHENEYREDLD